MSEVVKFTRLAIGTPIIVTDHSRTNYNETGKVVEIKPVDKYGQMVTNITLETMGLPPVNIDVFYKIKFDNPALEVQEQWHANDEIALLIEV